MVIEMIQTAAGPAGTFQTGQQYVVTDEMGLAFIRAGAAQKVEDTTDLERQVDEMFPETTALEAAETAARPTPKRRRRSTKKVAE